MVSFYFHIPFCTRKCDYCHFYVIPDAENAKDRLLEGFKLEWNQCLPHLQDKKVTTLYFGGGTPSLFNPHRLAQLIEMVTSHMATSSSIEITLEANPENITVELMRAYADCGVNRVSIGIQTLDPTLLTLLGRMHTPYTALKAVETTYEAGIHNISIDLMYDLPNQSLTHWSHTLDQIKEIPISHLSLYNLTIEPHTIFFKNRAQLRPVLPDEETSLAMYEMAIENLESINLKQYEISAFAKPGYESQHNSGYWTGRPFLGFGPSAFSYWEGKRFRNVAHLGKYCTALRAGQSPIDFEEKLDKEAHLRELFVIHLRLRQGVSMAAFISEHGKLDPLTLKTLEHLKAEGYLTESNEVWSLTKRGILFYDTVAAELI